MKLFGSQTSPFVRKCRITAIEAGLNDRVEFIETVVMDTKSVHPNPLNLVPSFQTDAGALMVDSPLICDYISALGLKTDAAAPATDWADRTLIALADGMTDRAVSITLEHRRPESLRSEDFMSRWRKAILATLPELSNRCPDSFTPGAIALVCALGYLDFRHDDLNWRAGHDDLAAWYADHLTRPSVIATEPPR